MESKEKLPSAPIQMTSVSRDMYPHDREMPSCVETLSNAQEQPPPYPSQNVYQQQVPPPVQTQMMVVQSGGKSELPPLGPRSVRLTCPVCNAHIKTSITTNSTGCAYVWCLAMMCFVCWLCSCIPFCMDSCKVFKHSCPKCKAYIGTYRP